MKLTVNLGENSYPIYIENNILNNAGAYISSCFSGKKIMIISDDNVFPGPFPHFIMHCLSKNFPAVI